MASKRPPSPGLIPNPFIKKRNLAWQLEIPATTAGAEDEAQPARAPPKPRDDGGQQEHAPTGPPTRPGVPAAVGPGTASPPDPAAHFFAHLARRTLSPYPARTPRLAADTALRDLFLAHAGSRRGAHFVVHQHDHPVAGAHYDLRLQVNATSSVSWAVMYGLPGDPSSGRPSRNATETRVHCLWNHVVETASAGTGSLVVWDCGRFEVLERGPAADPDSAEEGGEEEGGATEQEKLARAFGERKIRVRLYGSRLPERYVLNLRLTKGEDAEGRRRSARALGRPPRRRGGGGQAKKKKRGRGAVETSSRGSSGDEGDGDVVPDPLGAGTHGGNDADDGKGLSAMEQEIRELEDEHVRRTNAYAGAENSVGSVYQRRWYLSLDREACGFERRRGGGEGVWVPKDGGGGRREREGGDEADESGRLGFPFHVRGPDAERSVVTGRRGAEVLRDEGVEGFARRKGWRPVLG
ncbi:hypothetical protein ColTof4_07142 [Colletotrichum tofieldiae]|nr:hypothetical protein ColTof4_07142 [Colletotrichum tofieldiae]